MSTTVSTTVAAGSTLSAGAARRYVAPGLTAGAAFLGIEMLVGAFTTGLWRFPSAIAETIGLNSALSPALGVGIHFTCSLLLGALFVAFAERTHLRGRMLLSAGVLLMLIESPVSIWLILDTLYPTTLPILFAAVPLWASILGRITFGVVLALSVGRRGDTRRLASAAGPRWLGGPLARS